MTHSLTPFPVVFISYDEPNADKNYEHLLTIVPNALRVHHVKGFDAAHKAASAVALQAAPGSTNFFTVDGDNQLVPKAWTKLQNQVEYIRQEQTFKENQVYSWKAYNPLNALAYGNGGLKLWPHQWVQEMKTHEASPDGVRVDFCWDSHYKQMVNIVSQTLVTASPEQAWRAGFREGVKMSLADGKPQDLEDLARQVKHTNLARFVAWASLGADVKYGEWAMLGALMGFERANTGDTGQEHEIIIDYEELSSMFENDVPDLNSVAPEFERLRETCLRFNIHIPKYGKLQSQTCKLLMTQAIHTSKSYFEEETWTQAIPM